MQLQVYVVVICPLLDPRSLLRLGTTCRFLRDVTSEESLWRAMWENAAAAKQSAKMAKSKPKRSFRQAFRQYIIGQRKDKVLQWCTRCRIASAHILLCHPSCNV